MRNVVIIFIHPYLKFFQNRVALVLPDITSWTFDNNNTDLTRNIGFKMFSSIHDNHSGIGD